MRLYRRLGFQVVGVRRAYYRAAGGKEDAVVLCASPGRRRCCKLKPGRPACVSGASGRCLAGPLYDWANSAFSLTVVTAFVPVLLADYWNDGAPAAVTTFRLGIANGAASLLVALMAPLIGAIADRAGRRKRALLIFTTLGVANDRRLCPWRPRASGCWH